MNLFKNRKYIPIQINSPQKAEQTKERDANQGASEVSVPDGLWSKCPDCGKTVYIKEMGIYKLCPSCRAGFRLASSERIKIIADKDSFTEIYQNIVSRNPLSFPGYEEKIERIQAETGLKDGVVTGYCTIDGIEVVLCVMDSAFMMGSMGSVVGEKITRSFEYATLHGLPIIVFTASGGARMQEGIISLMQMAKVSAAVKRHSDEGLLYVTVLTDPTTGGVTASYAMLGDIILAEPKAVVGFAGRRVIEQTMKQKLPEGFQTAEFVLEHGFIDRIVKRDELRQELAKILAMHKGAV